MGVTAINDWIDGLQASGRYTFLREEAVSQTGVTPDAVRKALLRLVKKGRLAKVKDYFFVVVPVEYASAGSPPPPWFIYDLMAAMGSPYYVGLLSAASLHGAAHQQPQEFQVVTAGYIRPLRVGRVRIRFLTKRSCENTPTILMKTPTGTMRVSTPEATAIDLVRYAKAAGHFSHVAMVLKELAPSLNPQKLLETARAEASAMTAQRLGYILDHVGAGDVAKPMAAWLGAMKLHSIRLSPARPAGNLKPDPVWHVVPNEPLELDA